MEGRNARWVDEWVCGWMNGERKKEKVKISIDNSNGGHIYSLHYSFNFS